MAGNKNWGRSIHSVPNNGSAQTTSPNFLVIEFSRKLPSGRLEFENGDLLLKLGEERLLELEEGFTDVAQRNGDYSIGGPMDSELLWFWWMPRQK